MLIDGLKLMVIGMSAVFIFLTLMVIMISWVAKAVVPFSHLLQDKTPKKASKQGTRKPAQDNKNLIAAVIAAVHKYREDHE